MSVCVWGGGGVGGKGCGERKRERVCVWEGGGGDHNCSGDCSRSSLILRAGTKAYYHDFVCKNPMKGFVSNASGSQESQTTEGFIKTIIG